MISSALENHVLFETRIGCEELPTMMPQQIVVSFRRKARVTRCHTQFSTTTFSAELWNHAARLCKTVHNKCDHQIARLLPHPRKSVEKSVGLEDCNVPNCSDAQLPVVRTIPSEVVSRKTSRRASHVSVHRGFRRRKEDEESPRRCMASVRQGASEQQISTKSHRSTVASFQHRLNIF